MLWIILVCGLGAIGIFLERMLHLRRAAISHRDFLLGVRNVLDRGNADEAIQICEEAPGPVPALIRAAILHRHEPRHALAEAIAWLVKNYGTAEVTYGQVNRIQRGDQSWPFSGGDSGGGQTLRAMSSKLEGKVFYGHWGQNWTQLVQFRRGAVRSWSATPFGESDDPASPHYTDQAEKLFSQDKLKPTWFQPADLAGHIESTKLLHRP